MAPSKIKYYINPNATGGALKQAVVYYYPEDVTEILVNPGNLVSPPGKLNGDQFNSQCYYEENNSPQGPFKEDKDPGWNVPAIPQSVIRDRKDR